MSFAQAERLPSDGGINVQRVGTHVMVSVDGGGSVLMSQYNAARVLAGLSVLLGAPLAKATQKAIRL